MHEDISGIETDKVCYGRQIYHDIENPSEKTVVDPPANVLNGGVNDRVIVRAVCDYPQPQEVVIRGLPVSYDIIDPG